MRFELRVSHIDSDFVIGSGNPHQWTTTIEDKEAFFLFMNRVAIATTQYAVVEFPEIEICWENKRATLRAIEGQLFYTEALSSNRKDLRVIPEEVWRLLEGQSIEQAFAREPEEAYVSYGEKKRGRFTILRTVFGLACLLIFGICAAYCFQVLKARQSLVAAPSFVHIMHSEREILREYADVYLTEPREGCMVFELKSSGQFDVFELWFSPKRNSFVLVPVESHQVQGGLTGKDRALLAGDLHLIRLGADKISLHGVEYSRYGAALASLGEVVESTTL